MTRAIREGGNKGQSASLTTGGAELMGVFLNPGTYRSCGKHRDGENSVGYDLECNRSGFGEGCKEQRQQRVSQSPKSRLTNQSWVASMRDA